MDEKDDEELLPPKLKTRRFVARYFAESNPHCSNRIGGMVPDQFRFVMSKHEKVNASEALNEQRLAVIELLAVEEDGNPQGLTNIPLLKAQLVRSTITFSNSAE